MTNKIKSALKAAIEAMEYHTEQTRPIQKTIDTIAACKSALSDIEKCEPVPPIEYDADMDRYYIPMIGGWEIQTKGKGSTFRICNTKTHVRWPVLDEHLHEALEQMAKDNRHAYTSPISKESTDWQYFDEAYKKATESSEPDDWMNAALMAQQVRRKQLNAEKG